MCNLYSQTKGPDAIRKIVRGMERGRELNLQPQPRGIPDGLAPVVARDGNGGRALEMMRWGFPPPAGERALVTNARHLHYSFWRPHLQRRCVVPATAFCEYQDGPPPKTPTWFAPTARRATTGVRCFSSPVCGAPGPARADPRKTPVEGEHRLFAFLTTEPNDLVAPVHGKAMPVILATHDEVDRWLDGTPQEALGPALPSPAGMLTIVARAAHRRRLEDRI